MHRSVPIVTISLLVLTSVLNFSTVNAQGSWEVFEDYEGLYVTSIFMLDSNDGWAIISGYIYHWDGEDWSNVRTPSEFNAFSIYMLNSNDGWAVGSFGRTIHWDGDSWNEVPSTTETHLNSVFMVDFNADG
jgi:hypothetical protein